MNPTHQIWFQPLRWVVVTLLLVCPASAFSVDVLEEFIGRRQTIADMPADAGPIGKRAVVERAKGSLGVILQASATFELEGRKVSPRDLRLSWHRGNGLQPAITAGDRVVVLDEFDEDDTLRIAAWVFRSRSTIAMTLLPEGHEDRKGFIDLGYVKPDRKITLPKLDPDGAKGIEQIGPLKGLLVHPVLDTPVLVEALGYIDFADGSLFGPTTREVVVDPENEDALIEGMNKHTHAPSFSFRSSMNYTNADVDSAFTENLSTATRYGEPFRYYWMLYSDDSLRFHAVKQFRSPETLEPAYRDRLRLHHQQAISMFRIAAVFRAFRDVDPQQLVDFLNEAIDRRNAR